MGMWEVVRYTDWYLSADKVTVLCFIEDRYKPGLMQAGHRQMEHL